MSEYNTKNYTEQGGEVTHIGGKLVIDDGADISALIAAISDAGKASVMTDKEKAYGKEISDLIGDDVKILAGGVVTGSIKYVADYSSAFSGDESKGYFFPAHLSDAYKGQNIKVKRESGEDGEEKTAEDLDWVLRLTDGADTVFPRTANGASVKGSSQEKSARQTSTSSAIGTMTGRKSTSSSRKRP